MPSAITVEIKPPATITASFSTTTGILDIPVIEQYDFFGTNRYKVSLQYLPQNMFALLPNVSAVFSGYIPSKTWKPYVGLEPSERTAINYLGFSKPYSAIAVAVYNFNTKAVGDWDLKETADLSSGMQAGVYVNNKSGEVALAFRGTDELCLIPIVVVLSVKSNSLA